MGPKHVGVKCSQRFFKDLTAANTVVEGTAAAKLQYKLSLRFKLTNAGNAQYSFKVYDKFKNVLIDSLNESADGGELSFKTQLLMDYFFEQEQSIIIEINKHKGSHRSTTQIPTTLGCIVGSCKNTLVKKLDDGFIETLHVTAVQFKDEKKYLIIEFELDKVIDFTIPKNRLYYIINKGSQLYQSETVSAKGTFAPIRIPFHLIDGDFQIEFYNSKGRATHIINTSLSTIESLKNTSFTVPLSHRRNINLTHKSIIKQEYSFIEYLQHGVQIGLTVAIDFTGSNGHPNDAKSLHYIAPNKPNAYERAIMSCGNIIAYYDYDQMFPVFGFGAVLPNETEANMCFNINGTPDPHICTINSILETYRNVVFQLTFSGPTNFGDILRTTIRMIKSENNSLKYSVLLILTDGMICDMSETIDLIVEASKLPLSIVIVGIGNANFANMVQLDADDGLLEASNGEKAKRDLVQFVPFSQFEGNGEALAKEVLREIPKQIVEYYEMVGIYPQPAPAPSTTSTTTTSK